MTGSVYQKSALPAKLDLTKYNTREQLKSPAELQKKESKGAAADSKKDCNEVMRKDLRAWLVKHDITGPPPNAVAEQKAMWEWIRDFHQEYNEDWFSRNMPRLHEQFKPVFVQEMKAMKAAAKAVGPPTDMLDFETPAAVTQPSQASSSGAGMDLLDISEPASSPAASTSAPVANASSTLLDLDMGGSERGSASSAGYVGAQPTTTAPTPAPAGGNLLLDPFSGSDTAKLMSDAMQTTTASGIDLLNFSGSSLAAPAAMPGMDGLDFGGSRPAVQAAAPQAAASSGGLDGLVFGGLGLTAPVASPMSGGMGLAATNPAAPMVPTPTVAPRALPTGTSNEINLLDLL